MKDFYKVDDLTGEVTKETKYYLVGEDIIKERKYEKCNTIIYDSEVGYKEIVVFKDSFLIPKIEEIEVPNKEMFLDKYLLNEKDDTRNFKKVGNNVIAQKEGATISKYTESRQLSAIRSKKNFFNYALANEWEYFITLTFADQKIRYEYESIKEEWVNMKKLLLNSISVSNFKLLGVPEHHEDEAWHFHFLLSGCDLNLVPGRNNKVESKYYKQFVYSKTGAQIFNWIDFKKGWSQVCLIKRNTTEHLIFYISKYISKYRSVPFNCKSFWKTSNLDRREISYDNYNEETVKYFKDCNIYKTIKETDNMIIFREYFNN